MALPPVALSSSIENRIVLEQPHFMMPHLVSPAFTSELCPHIYIDSFAQASLLELRRPSQQPFPYHVTLGLRLTITGEARPVGV